MNDVKKGAVTVVLATVATTVLILISDKGNADSTESISEQIVPVKVEEETLEIVETKKVLSNFTEKKILTDKVIPKSGKDSHMPPPGPFLIQSAGGMIKPDAPKALMPPVSPEKPKQRVKGAQAPKISVEKPILSTSEPEAPKPTEKNVGDLKKPTAKQFAATKPFRPNVPSLNSEPKKPPVLLNMTPTMKPNMADKPVAPQLKTSSKQIPKNSGQPIWMQGNNLNVTNPAHNIKKGINSTNQMNAIQAPNAVSYMQQYRYMPMPVYPNYQYPQMPRYNGGYFFAPVPNHWMQGGMQMPQSRIQLNNASKASNEPKGLNK